MSDVTEAPNQDAIAESLLGDQTEDQAVEQPVTEQPTDTEVQAPEVEAEQAPETAEDWLPTEQDKVFSDDTYARYAERYGLTPQQATDPQLRQLLHDKINSDILIRQQQEQEQFQQEEPEQEAQPEPTQQPQPLSREQYFQNLDQMIQRTTDPQVAKDFHADFLRAFGVSEAEIAKMPPEQAMRFTTTASKYMLNLMNTHIGSMLQGQLQPQLAQMFPGFDQMYERSSYAMAWDNVRNSNPQFSSLPAYGTKEFSQTLREAAARIPGFDDMQFNGRDGKPLPPAENAVRKYTMLAQQASGQTVDPKLVQQAAAAGARNQRRADVRRAAGNLGSGQSTSAAGKTGSSSQFQTNTDLFDGPTMDIWQREHGRL